jgi:hypothetical protein
LIGMELFVTREGLAHRLGNCELFLPTAKHRRNQHG